MVLTLAVIPDVDLLLEPTLAHRGPLHSIIILVAVFIPLFIVYRKVAAPYFLALAQHSLIGDYLGGGQLQLLWPLNQSYYGLATNAVTIIVLEWILFLSSMLIMVKTRDVNRMLQAKRSNLLLLIPLVAVSVPPLFSFPLRVPFSLIPAHAGYGLLFFASITWTTTKSLHRNRRQATALN